MIKKLFLMAALLAPGLAYGGNPSADLTVQIVPAGSGPPVAAPAAAAGFTTLAYNFDFSQPMYATQSNWLDCSGTDASKVWHVGAPGGISSLPCNINQAIDPLDSSTVLRLQYLQSYGFGDASHSVSMQTVTNGGDAQGGTVTASYPNFYAESTYRIDQVSATPEVSGPNGVWDWQAGGNTIECDYAELWIGSGGFGDGGCGNWLGPAIDGWFSYDPSGSGSNLPAGWSTTAYHKYGALYTSDGSTSVKICFFVDDIRQWCADASASSTQYLQKNWLVAWVVSGAAAPPPVFNLYIKNIHVFSCANWKPWPDQTVAGQCNGTTLFNDPAPNHGGLVYWH
jgi:hypothetical protein